MGGDKLLDEATLSEVVLELLFRLLRFVVPPLLAGAAAALVLSAFCRCP